MNSLLRSAALLLASLVMSCSANSESGSPYGNQPAGGSGGSAGDDASIPVPDGSSGGMDGTLPNPEAASDVPMSDGDTCSGIAAQAEPYPLDMYVMMDQSGSMGAPANPFQPFGPTQWTAVKDAFVNFLNATPASGLSMGIQYFPLAITPWSQMQTCSSSGSGCSSTEICGTMDNGSFCLAKCTSDANCPGSECRSVDDGNGGTVQFCSNDSCDVDQYATPEVEIASIPGVNQALLDSLDAHEPLTMTPSAPSLEGAIQHAREWAVGHPNTTTIVVFATDGQPTVCSSGSGLPIVEVQQIAAAGVAGTPSIKTFVIGVVTAGVPGTANALHSIAANGGTDQAFIIDPAVDMTNQFAAALEAIRGAFMECEFKIPTPSGLPNWDEVNVIYTGAGGGGKLFYVEDVSQCDPATGGWYYDINPAQGTPTKIILCPQNCDFIQGTGGSIDIEIGCKTITPPK